MRGAIWLAGAALAAGAAPAAAHHTLTGYEARQITLEGRIAEFSFTNPHPFLTLQVRRSGAPAESWRLEMDNLFELDGIGVTKATFRPGDQVTVTGAPGRDGARTLYLRRLDRPSDGLRYEQIGFTPSLTFPHRKTP
jgi:hypothetical protein